MLDHRENGKSSLTRIGRQVIRAAPGQGLVSTPGRWAICCVIDYICRVTSPIKTLLKEEHRLDDIERQDIP
ncbi:hypothetical protein NPIL_685131 [Nephila pilipes]|uniref:Uncharacterized protein n=1 Tax=Nephila pilipes TaxID=299642 RepID=A0A8X6PCK4_NEPPI|nr:hypothetical protein NPIL_685131 [Nephila pilipes]